MKRKACIVPKYQPVKCYACNGSGWYDAVDKKGRGIRCGACEGTGMEYGHDR